MDHCQHRAGFHLIGPTLFAFYINILILLHNEIKPLFTSQSGLINSLNYSDHKMVASFHGWCLWPWQYPKAMQLCLEGCFSSSFFPFSSQVVLEGPRDCQASQDARAPEVMCSGKLESTSSLPLCVFIFLSPLHTFFLCPLHSSLPLDHCFSGFWLREKWK